jgi:hypothetical protein
LKVQNRTVFIRYRKPHGHRLRTLALEAMEFIRRFLQHVLPTGFMKVRYYGFLNPNCHVLLDRVSTLIEMSYDFNFPLPKTDPEPWQPFPCPTCGGTLRLCSLLLPRKILVYSG